MNHKYSEVQLAKVLYLRQQLLTLPEIATKLGIAYETAVHIHNRALAKEASFKAWEQIKKTIAEANDTPK